jgi:hypothetical protein
VFQSYFLVCSILRTGALVQQVQRHVLQGRLALERGFTE